MNNTQDNRSTFIAIALCVIFYMGYTKYLENKYPHLNQKNKAQTQEAQNSGLDTPSGQTTTNSKAVSPKVESIAAVSKKYPALTEKQLVLESDKLRIKFDQNASAVNSVFTKDYFLAQDKKSETPQLVERQLLDSPLVVQGLAATAKSDSLEGQVVNHGFYGLRQGREIRFWREEFGWLIEQSFSMPEKGYKLNVSVKFTNKSQQAMPLHSYVLVKESVIPAEGGGLLFPAAMYEPKHWQSVTMNVADETERYPTQKYCDPDEEIMAQEEIENVTNEQIRFFGLESRYFVKAFVPEAKRLTLKAQRFRNSKQLGCELGFLANLDQGMINPGQSVTMNFGAYFGPKEIDTLTAADEKLDSAMNLGWFSIIAYPLLSLLKIFYALTKNYGIAIIIVTILLKIVFYPLTKQAAISAQKMKKIQPEMKRLQEQFKDDRQRMQLELIKLYKTYKVNPAKSCLPILPTIPVFIAFYNVLMYAFELRQAPFAFWLQDLSAKDPIYITPVLLGVFMLIQMKLTPNAGMDKNQQRIMMMMPIIFTFAMVSLPAGLVLYMLTNSILTIVQQQWLNKKLENI